MAVFRRWSAVRAERLRVDAERRRGDFYAERWSKAVATAERALDMMDAAYAAAERERAKRDVALAEVERYKERENDLILRWKDARQGYSLAYASEQSALAKLDDIRDARDKFAASSSDFDMWMAVDAILDRPTETGS